jgi:hypothetical protein
VDRM